MVWIMDTYMNTVGHVDKNAQRRIVTGKTLTSGGSYGRKKATSTGAIHCLTEWARDHRFDLEGKTAAIQGFGNVGSHAAMLLSKLGVSIVAVGDHTGYRHMNEGFSPHRMSEHVRQHGSLEGYENGEEISRKEFFEVDADILIPAALENQIGRAEAQAIKAKVVVEGANGPTNPDGEEVLRDRGIAVIPDVLANSGGVTVSYYEWVQNGRSERWSSEDVEQRLETAMKRAYQQVDFFANETKVDLRTASYALALRNLATAYVERGIFP